MTAVKEKSEAIATDTSIETGESWEGLLMNPFLNAEHFKEKEAPFVVLEWRIAPEDENNKPRVSLTLERKKEKYRFDLNVTNAKFVRNADVTPNGLVGKILTITKVNVTNPKTGKIVEGLRICKIE